MQEIPSWTVKKIAVIGCAGSGKSYLSLKLNEFLKIPCYHLDVLFWKPNWIKTPEEEFKTIINKIMDKYEWIIDGNYGNSMEDRFQNAEVVIFLDMPTDLCLESEKSRRGRKRVDLPEYLVETDDAEFIEFIKNFNGEHRNKIVDLIEKYPKVKVITFASREEVNQFLSNLTCRE